MGRILKSLIIPAFLLIRIFCQAQDPVEVSDPRIRLEENQLHIFYDILNSQSSDLFEVSLSVTDERGNLIKATSLNGDIGENIPGGNNRHIIWNIIEDQVEVEGDIIVVVVAMHLPSDDSLSVKSFSRSGLILQSLVLPGLGMSRLTGDPHWIRGVAGYGCLAGSILLNKAAVSTYSDFKNATSIEDANSLLEKSTRQDNISEVLAYSALGIWIVDIVWTLVGSSDLKRQTTSGTTRGISIGSGFDPYSNRPLLAFTYTF